MNSTATMSTSSLSEGSHSVTASYGGDSAFVESVSPAVNEVISSVIASATFSTSSLSSGQHSIVASYGGDSSHLGSTSSALGQGISPSSGSAVVTLSVHLQDGSHAVTASYGGDGVYGGSTSPVLNQVVGDVVIPSVATISTSSLGSGSHQVKAVYEGSATHGPSTSPILNQQVTSGTRCGWTATVMPSGKSVAVRCARPNGSSYQLRPASFRADGVTLPKPTIEINGGPQITLSDCLWAEKSDSYPDYGNPNFFFPIPQPAPDLTYVDDRNSMVLNGTSSHAVTASNLSIPGQATFIICFKATDPSTSPRIASQGNPAAGGWEISLGGTSGAMTVTFTGGGKTITVSQLTHYQQGWSLIPLGQYGYYPRYTSKGLWGPVPMVAGEWYRALVVVSWTDVTLTVCNSGYALTDNNGNIFNSVVVGQATTTSSGGFPQVAAPLYLGRTSAGGSYFSGKLCDVQLHNGPYGIYHIYNLTDGGFVDYGAPGAIAMWGGPSSSTVADISGQGAPSLTTSNVGWDADVMVAGVHHVEGTDLSSSHGSLSLSGGTWSPVQWQDSDYVGGSAPGFNGRYWQSTAAGATATFTNSSLVPGRSYKVAICYVGDFDRASNVSFVVHDGSATGPVLFSTTLDQTKPCIGLSWDCVSWKPMATVIPTGSQLTIVMTNPTASKKLVADCIRFEGVRPAVSVKPSDVATITFPDAWAGFLDYPSQAPIDAAGGTDVQLVNRSGDIFNQGVKTNPRTMKVGYNLGPVANGGPSYFYRNRVKDQNYWAGTVALHSYVLSDFRGQCDVTPSGLWTVKYRTLDGSGNHVTIGANDSAVNVLGSTVVDNGEVITGGIATRTYSVTCSPSRNSPVIGLSMSGNIDYSTVAVYPPDPSNPSQSLAPTGSDPQDVWHPNFLANMSVGLESLRNLGLSSMYNAAVFSDYGMSSDPKIHYFDQRERSGALITSISPIDNNPDTDADGVFGFGYMNNLCFYKVRTATPHNMYQGDCFGFSGTNMPGGVLASFPGHPGQEAYADFGNVRWDGPLSFSSGLVVAVLDPTTFVVEVSTSWYPPSYPANGAPGTIAGTTTPAMYGANDWTVHSWVGYGMPLDHIVDLANRTGAMPHFCLGHMVTAQGARDLGTYFATHLKPGLGIRVEYANEPFSFFPQFRYYHMWSSYGAYKESKGLPAPYGSWNKDISYAALSVQAANAFKAGWQSTGRNPSEVRHFLNYVVNGMGWMAARAHDYGATNFDIGYSPYYFNDYYLSGAGSYYNWDIGPMVDRMDVEVWLDHFELVITGGWDYWAGHYAAEGLVREGFGHWVDSSGNPYGDRNTVYFPGLKYVPGGPNGSASIVTYEGGSQQIAMSWGSGSSVGGSYMMPTKNRQMYRHPRMKSVNDSCLQVLNDLGNSNFTRFQTGGFANKGMIRYWSDLDLYNQTYGTGDGTDGKNNNIVTPESNDAISPMYTSIRNWAKGIR